MKRPIVLFVCLWITGYVLALYVSVPWLSGTASLLLAGTAGFWYAFRLPLRLPICALLLVGVAMGYYHWTDQRNSSALLPLAQQQEQLSGSGISLHGSLASPVSVDGDRASFTVEAESVRFQDRDSFPMRGEHVQVSLRLLRQEQQVEAAGWRRGDTLTLQGELLSPSPARNYGGFDYRRYLRLHRIHWLVTAKGTEQAQVEPAPLRVSSSQLLRWNDGLRSALDARMDSIFPERHAGLMKAMLIGQQDDLDPERFQQFSALGLTHILAISGLNVAVFLSVFIWIMRRLGLTKENYLLLAMILLPFYILITGASPSIVRAGLMAMIALYAARRGILKDALHLMAIVAWVMLIWNPYYLLDVSFQLSFLVTLGLIVGVTKVSLLLPFNSSVVRNALSITIVSQLISFPVSIYYFNQFSLLSWAANMLLVPVMSSVVFPAGLIALAVGLIYVPLGRGIGWLLSWLNDGIFWVTDQLEQFRMFQTIWPSPSIAWIAGYYGILMILYFLLAKRKELAVTAVHTDSQGINHSINGSVDPKLPMIPYEPFTGSIPSSPVHRMLMVRTGLLLSAISLAALLFVGYTPDRWSRSGLVQFIDVGQGDSILIRTPEGKHILVDGGGTLTFGKQGEKWKTRKDAYEVGRKLLVPLLKKRGVHQLDMLILSHEDADHSGGLQAVLEQIPVKQFLFNGTYKPNQGVEKLFRTALQHHIPLIAAEEGQSIVLDARTQLFVQYPFKDEHNEVTIAAEQNNQSVVFLMQMDGTSWLFTGDMEKDTEMDLLEAWADGSGPNSKSLFTAASSGASSTVQSSSSSSTHIDVLKVAHHGSKTSSTQAWLDYWKPKIAVISVGEKNSYGHPSVEVVQRLEQSDTGIFRTDQMGEVQLEVRKGSIFGRFMLDKRE